MARRPIPGQRHELPVPRPSGETRRPPAGQRNGWTLRRDHLPGPERSLVLELPQAELRANAQQAAPGPVLVPRSGEHVEPAVEPLRRTRGHRVSEMRARRRLTRIASVACAASIAAGAGSGQWNAVDEHPIVASDGTGGDAFGQSVGALRGHGRGRGAVRLPHPRQVRRHRDSRRRGLGLRLRAHRGGLGRASQAHRRRCHGGRSLRRLGRDRGRRDRGRCLNRRPGPLELEFWRGLRVRAPGRELDRSRPS